MVRGICVFCNEEKELTEHHNIGVMDIMKMHPEFTLEQAKAFKKKKEKERPSTRMLPCRECHDKMEHLKKMEMPETRRTDSLIKKGNIKGAHRMITKEEKIEKYRRKYGKYWNNTPTGDVPQLRKKVYEV